MLALTLALALSVAGPSDFDAIVERLMKAHDVPGVGLALVKDGKPLLAKGYGVADAATGERVTEKTVFSLGSVSKSFAAVTAMKLVEEKRLSLDTSVASVLEGFRLSDGEATRALTLRHALSHTSGLPRLPEWILPTRADIVKRLSTVPLDAAPGAAWRYCNQNFILAGHVVERVAGKPWEEVLAASVLDPLGMTSSYAANALARGDGGVARPHVLDVRRGQRTIAFESHLEPWGPSGNVRSSAADMARYLAFHAGGGPEILSSGSLAEMHREQVSLEQSPAAADRFGPLPVKRRGYGLGFYTEEFRGVRLASHEGTLDGFTASVTIAPEAGAGIAILTNADHANLFVAAARLALLEALLGMKPDGAGAAAEVHARAGFDPEAHRARLESVRRFVADPAAFAGLAGTYASVPPGGPTLVVAVEGGAVTLTVNREIVLDLVPFENDGFIVNSHPMIGRALRFVRGGEGQATIVADGRPIGVRTSR